MEAAETHGVTAPNEPSAAPSPAPEGTTLPEPQELSVTADPAFVQMAYRVTFLESVCTQLVREIQARGLVPRTFPDAVIDQAETDVDANPHRITGVEEGRSGLIAAHLTPPRDG